MKHTSAIVLAAILLVFSSPLRAVTWTALDGDFEYSFNGVIRPEIMSGQNVSLFNRNHQGDKIFFARHTLDLKFDALWGAKTFGASVVEFLFGIRNRSIWGNPSSIASTTETPINFFGASLKAHKHAIPRHIFWMREAWLWIDLNKFLGLHFGNRHTLMLGAFPFMLGRGIALGDAYAVGNELLGFYNDGIVDQFAFGGKLSGAILAEILTYDLYAAILQNKCSSLSDTGEKIFGQEFQRRKTPERGFGKVNFALAGRVNWHAFNHPKFGKLVFEPYALFNFDPEQTVEFLGDANSKLGTLGLATEYYGDKFEFGFDCALNLGYQHVKGWDRNQVKEENRNGTVVLVNSAVVDENGKKVLYVPGSDAQKLIDESDQNEDQNGLPIKKTTNPADTAISETLINAKNRFRNSYNNRYNGWMFVTDAGWWIYKKDLLWSFAVGAASGDENPNVITKDGVFSGFIGLQEIYSGKRVRSAFLMGGAGKAKRPLSAPTEVIQVSSPYAISVSGFTNLVFFGSSLLWKPSNWSRQFSFNPNIMVYWQQKATKKFNALQRIQTGDNASRFLGVETNVFIDYYVFKTMKVFFVPSVFFPGSHYEDIRGLPLNKDQDDLLKNLAPNFSADRLPNIGKDIAYTLNLGLEFRF